jgi:nucleotide-binding universal stress UspA family protein
MPSDTPVRARPGLIVLPLDGSSLSEGALPYAEAFARAIGASLLLVTVWEGIDTSLSRERDLVGRIFTKEEHDHREYLSRVAQRLEQSGLHVETEFLIGQPADEILRVVGEREPRLLVLATHGRSGLSRWRYGSVASRLVREAPVPTVVVGPNVLEQQRPPAIRRILVPLDGSPLAESALPVAEELAASFGAELVLARVLERTFGPIGYYGIPELDVAQLDRELAIAAKDYLQRVRERVPSERPVEISLQRGTAAGALIDLVDGQKIDLVVMASHTRAGFARAMLGSVADRMLQCNAPVLLVRPEAMSRLRHAARGRYCSSCGRASPYIELLSEDRCLRCGRHLRACVNCVYYDGTGCLLQRPELHSTYPGRDCPYFQFREANPKEATPAQTAVGRAPTSDREPPGGRPRASNS